MILLFCSLNKPPGLDQLSSAILSLVELLGEQLDGVIQLDHLAHQLPMGVVVASLIDAILALWSQDSCGPSSHAREIN